MNYKLIILFSLYLLASLNFAKAQSFTEEIKHHRVFYVSPAATLELNNKYGNIHISTWEEDSISIDINFFISEKSEAKFNKIKDNVQFKIGGNSAFLSAETVFGSKYSSFFKNIKEATNMLSSPNNNSRIDYFVKVPSYINLKIENRYGDIFIPDFHGNINVQLSNGDFQARKISGSNILNLEFGNVIIEQLEQSTLNLNFAEVNIDKAGQLDINSKSSKVNIKDCNLIKLKSKRDEYSIDNIGFVFGDTYFSKLSIYNLNNEYNMVMQYGELKHLGIAPAYKLIRINSAYTNCTLVMENPVAYKSTIKGPKSNIILAQSISSNEANWEELVKSNPVSFYYKSQTAKEKVQVQINDATLKISHK
ncbi:hypothetical protein [Carboxylicivirga sp. N1Y90]|uniref:hypothetical protein n=1 Tax=Carboxylicivirga fragile TaxID=3417571 RepID=UPI003D325507|nr:hypothetical protein [Marinilabiliaceae bacterium N1Y90]